MSLFPQAVEAHLAGRTVRFSLLVLFDFLTDPVRLWTGSGTIASGGHEWSGIGELGSISGLEQAVQGEAPETTFQLSGINSNITSIARDEFEDEAQDRKVQIFLQFHNLDDDQPLELYDEPYAIWSGKMQNARFDIDGPSKRVITVVAESLFALRSRPAYSQYTDADQQRRFSGDIGFAFVPGLINKVVTWPDF